MTIDIHTSIPQTLVAWRSGLRKCGALTMAVAIWGCTGDSSAGSSPQVPDCVACTLSFTPIVSIGDKGNPGTVPDWPVFAFNGQRILLVSDERDAIHQYGPDGSLVASLGSSGDGPGELRGADGVSWISSDSFLVHRSDGRLIAFGRDGVGLDKVRIDPGCGLESNALPIVCVGEGGPDMRSPVVRVLNSDGESRFEFTPKPGRVQDGRCVMCRARVATAGEGAMWAVSRRFHLVELWGTDGKVRRSVDLTKVLEQIISDSIGVNEPGQLRTMGAIPVPSVGGVAIIDGFIRKQDRVTTPVVAEVNGVRVQSDAIARLMQVRPLGSIISIVDTAGHVVAAQFFRERTFLPAGGRFLAELSKSSEELPVLVVGELAIQQ
jgi:hypothetical protein